ncbi:hypothetical protein DL98DRAFT_552796 [Cadophora sp. DSE1049]|nr:hypothetical protein DL98DRAFT_552796 [Cadophora sp. DSE1049]
MLKLSIYALIVAAAVQATSRQQNTTSPCFKDPLKVETHINGGASLEMISSLIIGSEAAVLIDMPLLIPQAEDLAAWVRNTTDKPLVAVFTTHFHPSDYWSAIYGATNVSQAPTIPSPYDFTFFTLPSDEATPIQLLSPLGAPSPHTTQCTATPYIPWIADLLTPALTESWITTLDFIASLAPNSIIPGHAAVNGPFAAIQDLLHTKAYLEFWQSEIEAKRPDAFTPQEIFGLLDKEFPGRLEDVTSTTLLNITSEHFGRGGFKTNPLRGFDGL